MRYGVLLLLCLAAVIAYVQRTAITVPTKVIQRDLGIDEWRMGLVMGSWYWGYALLQLPAGWLADRWGSRAALVLFAASWSVLTGLTGLATDFYSLLAVWTAMGLAQAGVFPAATKAIGAWFPAAQRASASGWLICGQLAGAALAPPLVAQMLGVISWQQSFALVAVPGLLWAVMYRVLTPSRTEPTPERLALGAVLGRMLTSTSMQLLCAQQFLRSAAMTFFFTWFPRYLQETHHVTATQSGWLAAMPPVAAMAGGMSGGLVSDWLLRTTGNRRLSRQGVAVAGMLGCTALTLAAYFVADPLASVGLISAGALCGVFGGVSGYSVAIEFGGKRVATVFATMNMCGNVGSALFPIAVGYLVGTTGQWDLALLLFAGLFAADAVLWALLNPRKPLFEESYDAR